MKAPGINMILTALIAAMRGRFHKRDAIPADAAEILRKRAEAHAAACADLDDDPLIQALFGKPETLKPIQPPMQQGWLFRKQAE